MMFVRENRAEREGDGGLRYRLQNSRPVKETVANLEVWTGCFFGNHNTGLEHYTAQE